jgi:hypothetical protein
VPPRLGSQRRSTGDNVIIPQVEPGLAPLLVGLIQWDLHVLQHPRAPKVDAVHPIGTDRLAIFFLFSSFFLYSSTTKKYF